METSTKPIIKYIEFIYSIKWTYAKTMPEWPHEYIVRERVNQQSFDDLANFIDTHGYEEYFYKRKQAYYDIGDHTYWHMGNIINRCRKEDTFAQRKLFGTLP